MDTITKLWLGLHSISIAFALVAVILQGGVWTLFGAAILAISFYVGLWRLQSVGDAPISSQWKYREGQQWQVESIDGDVIAVSEPNTDVEFPIIGTTQHLSPEVLEDMVRQIREQVLVGGLVCRGGGGSGGGIRVYGGGGGMAQATVNAPENPCKYYAGHSKMRCAVNPTVSTCDSCNDYAPKKK